MLALLGGMVLAYYAAAEAMGSVWGKQFLAGWGAMALLSPVPGVFVWYARGRSLQAWVLSGGVLAFQMIATVVLFDRLGFLDILAVFAAAAVLFRDKLGPPSGGKTRG